MLLRRWWFWLLVAGAVLLAPTGVGMIADVAERGPRLSRSDEDENGVIIQDPRELWAEAQRTLGREFSFEAYCLARMTRSESPLGAGQRERVMRCNVAVNDARELGWDIPRVIMFHTVAFRDGRFGEQTKGRYASRQDPYRNDLEAAEYALTADLTDGAVKFVDGAATLERVRDSWGGEGLVPGTLPDAAAYFFWRGGLPPRAEAA